MKLCRQPLETGQRRQKHARRAKCGALTLTVTAVIVYLAACGSDPPAPEAANTAPEATPAEVRFVFPDKDYSKFDHQSEQHVRLPCLLCHTREDNSPQMKFSGHIPCASCHTEHFQQNDHAICSICHTDPKQGGEMKAFPTLASFKTRFDHAVHLTQANCADCHKPARGGASFSTPTRAGAHAACFQCHSPNAEFEGRDIASCRTCHEPGQPGRNFGGVAAMPASFSHSSHSRVGCANCHTVMREMPRGSQVTAPRAAMHFASARGNNCATCHNGRRAFGGEDFANCKRCHQGSSFGF